MHGLTFSATVELAEAGRVVLRERTAQPPHDPQSLPRAVLAVGEDVLVTLRREAAAPIVPGFAFSQEIVPSADCRWCQRDGAATCPAHRPIEPAPAEEYARCCVAALVTDDAGRLLLIRSRKPGRGWELPGGKVRASETWRDALRREVREEAGVDIAIADDPPLVLDGQRVQGAPFTSIILVTQARASGEPVAGDDAAEARWFAADALPLEELSQFASTRVVRAWALEASR